MVANGNSNRGSLEYESDIIPPSYGAPRVYSRSQWNTQIKWKTTNGGWWQLLFLLEWSHEWRETRSWFAHCHQVPPLINAYPRLWEILTGPVPWATRRTKPDTIIGDSNARVGTDHHTRVRMYWPTREALQANATSMASYSCRPVIVTNSSSQIHCSVYQPATRRCMHSCSKHCAIWLTTLLLLLIYYIYNTWSRAENML